MSLFDAAARAIHKNFSLKERKRLAGTGAAMPDGSYPIKSEQDLKNAIKAYGRAKNPEAVKRHIVRRARSLGLTRLLPEDWEGSTKDSSHSSQPLWSSHSVIIPDGDTPPEWIELLPAGRFKGNDGRGPYQLDDPQNVITKSNAQRGLVIDFNHATDFGSPLGLDARAAGWIRELQVREGAIWGRVEWTEKGAAAIAAKEYRFISPVFTHSKDGQVIALERAGLTNNPNLNLAAVAAAQIPRRSAMAGEEDGNDMSLSKVIAGLEKVFPHLPPARLLGIAKSAMDSGGDFDDDQHLDDQAADDAPYLADESADEMRARHEKEMAQCAAEDKPALEAKHAEQRKAFEARHTHAAEASDARMAQIVARHPTTVAMAREIQKLCAERNREKAEIAVNAAMKAGKISESLRDWAMNYAVGDLSAFNQYVEKAPPIYANLDKALINGSPADADPAKRIDSRERAVCAQLGIGTEDYLKSRAARLSVDVHETL